MEPGTVVEVGKFYNVKCAILLCRDGKRQVVPIIGIEHADKQFLFPHKHYHHDGRFGRYYPDGRTNAVVVTDDPGNHGYTFEGTTIKRRRCLRLETGLLVDYSIWTFKAHWYVKWYESMIGKSCAGKKCPHLGTPMEDKSGILVCPLHNLHGCKKTETIRLPPGVQLHNMSKDEFHEHFLKLKNEDVF